MFDIDAITTALLILAAIAAVLVLTWALGAGDPTDLGLLFGRPWELSWPRGVQERSPSRGALTSSTAVGRLPPGCTAQPRPAGCRRTAPPERTAG